MQKASLEERVLIWVESAQDTARVVGLLSDLNIEGFPCRDYAELCDQIGRGAVAVILSEPPDIGDPRSSRLLSILGHQPTWSALPTIIISRELSSTDRVGIEFPLGVTFIERPVRLRSLASIIRTARHARRSQYTVRELISEREILVEQLRGEVRIKNEFIATLAHELRNPLAPIRTGLQILRMSQTQRPSIQTLDMMERQVRHLVRLIDDLLDISRITLGKLELQKQKVALDVLLSSAVEASKPMIDAGKHTFTTSLPNEPITLEVDPVRIAQVITNLLNNAARYTPNGGVIELIIRCEDGTIRIEVKDNGVGLTPEMLSKVFDMFSQAKSSMGQSHGGLGIGLTLARRLTEMHGGTLQASSPGPGKGCTFRVTLPLEGRTQLVTEGIPAERNGSHSVVQCQRPLLQG